MRKIHIVFAFFIVAVMLPALPSCLFALQEDVSRNTSIALSENLPFDPQVKIGTFENGVKYYIRVNKKPEDRAELRLVVNAGSVLENDNQQGLAHFCEHMAFNGTLHFAKNELVDYLESIGMRFGPDLNAYTSFDETVYMLQIPTDSASIVENAFQILEDWAHNVSYDDKEIDKERGVIIEEWRLGRGAEARMRDKQFPILFKGSQYAVRLPIGKKDILDSFQHDTLRRFYKDWYRPDLQAVIAVGDFDMQWIESLIKKHFASIPAKKDERKRELFPVPDNKGTLFAIASDPEATRTSVSIYYKMDVKPEKTIADYRRQMIGSLYNSMLNQRFDEKLHHADPPFLYAYSGKGRFVRTKEVYLLSAGVKDNMIPQGLETLLTESRRVKEYGFTQTELERKKKEMMRGMEQALKERDKTESRNYVAEYTRNFLVNEPIPGIENEFKYYKELLPGIQLSEVNKLASEWIHNSNRVVLVNSPEKKGVKVPTKEDLLAIMHKVDQMKIDAYVDQVSDEPLVKEIPKSGKIVAEKAFDSLGVTQWKLSNGVRVVLKPTNFKNDEIRFTSFSPGGNSLVGEKDYIPAITAAAVVGEGGLGSFSQIDLQKKLSGKVVCVSPYIGTLTEGISGSASPEDMKTMFQLIYLYFTAPRMDSTAFQSYKTRMKGFIENRSARPETAFQDTIQVTMAQHHYRARPWSLALLDEMNLSDSFQIYKQRFADASDFTFFFVGNFDTLTIKKDVLTYLGSLPATHRNETWKDPGIEPPKGVVEKTINKGMAPKSQVRFMFTGPYRWSRQNNYDLQSMTSVLRIKLREVLREDLGGTYGVAVWASTSKYPKEEYTLGISFGCAPDRVEELSKNVIVQIDSLKKFPPAKIYLQKVKETQLRKNETNLKQNRFWLRQLNEYYFTGLNPYDILQYPDLVDHLNAETIRSTAENYFNMKNYVRVVLFPEKPGE